MRTKAAPAGSPQTMVPRKEGLEPKPMRKNAWIDLTGNSDGSFGLSPAGRSVACTPVKVVSHELTNMTNMVYCDYCLGTLNKSKSSGSGRKRASETKMFCSACNLYLCKKCRTKCQEHKVATSNTKKVARRLSRSKQKQQR